MILATNLGRVGKSLGNREVLKDVSFAVEPGDILGYLGPDGAVKTTTIRVILKLLPPDSGKAYILGRSVERDDAREKLGFALEAGGGNQGGDISGKNPTPP